MTVCREATAYVMSPTPETTASNDYLYRFVKTLRGSLLLSTVAIGFALLAVAVLLDSPVTITSPYDDAVLAGMFAIFGVSAILGGGSFYLVLKLVQRR